MPKVIMSLGDDLKLIRQHAEKALGDAKQVKDRFGTDLVNWNTVSVEAVEYFIDDANNEGYRVWIGEADAPTLAQFIRVWLAEEGFEDVRVKTEN